MVDERESEMGEREKVRVFSKPKMFGRGNRRFTTNERGEVWFARADQDFPHVSTDDLFETQDYLQTGYSLLGPVMYQYGPEKPTIKD